MTHDLRTRDLRTRDLRARDLHTRDLRIRVQHARTWHPAWPRRAPTHVLRPRGHRHGKRAWRAHADRQPARSRAPPRGQRPPAPRAYQVVTASSRAGAARALHPARGARGGQEYAEWRARRRRDTAVSDVQCAATLCKDSYMNDEAAEPACRSVARQIPAVQAQWTP